MILVFVPDLFGDFLTAANEDVVLQVIDSFYDNSIIGKHSSTILSTIRYRVLSPISMYLPS